MNESREKLSTALRRIIDDNQAWLDRNGIKVVKSTVEDSKKYGPQLVIILKTEGKDER